VNPLIEQARKDERESAKVHQGYRLTELETGYSAFKESTGIDLLERNGHPIYNMREVCAAIKLITELHVRPVAEIMEAKKALSAGLSAIDAALSVLDTSQKL
jgi:pyruvate/oxaloacetate carboxyltransferase